MRSASQFPCKPYINAWLLLLLLHLWVSKSSISLQLFVRPISLDSGVFSAFTKGKQIDIKEYAEFIKQNKNKITVASNLDVIGSGEQTYQNQKQLEALGAKVLPTFHYGDDFKYLKKYAKDYNYIAVGGLVPVSNQKNKLISFLDKTFNITKNTIKLHGFGVGSYKLWERYPWYSTDATSWLGGPRFRRVKDFAEAKFVTSGKRDKTINGVRANSQHYHKLAEQSAQAYLKAAIYVTRLWETRGVKWN